MLISSAIAALLFFSNAAAAEPPVPSKGEEIRSAFLKWESQNGGAALSEKQVRAYANDARCLLKMHCFDEEVFVIGNDAYLERVSEKSKDLCRQTVLHSPEKIYVRTQCFRTDDNSAYELMENVMTFPAPVRKKQVEQK